MHDATALEKRELAASPPVPSSNRWARAFFIVAGSLLVGIGVLGIFLPLLPTTVFFLMAAACYGKSSPGAYRWLTTNRWFGRYLREYREERSSTLRNKVVSIASLWLGVGFSAYLLSNPWVTAALIVVASAVTFHLTRLRRVHRES